MPVRWDVLIIGTGHGGAQAAIALRQRKYRGTIALVGAELDAPYERPPLTKEYLCGQKNLESILIRPQTFWRERNITLQLGSRALAVDAKARTVSFSSGPAAHYGALVWAAGGQPRTLSCAGAALQGVHYPRSRTDVERITQELPRCERVVIVGGGYIGLEAAASLRKLGKQVTVVEALDRVLARVAGEQLSRFYEGEHRAHGVSVLLDTKVQCIEGQNGRATGLRTAAGHFLAADLIIVGIGIAPICAPLLEAGAKGDNGIAVDEFGRTSLPEIYAIGDCALHPSQHAEGALIRIESVQHATEMAMTVAKAITGELVPYDAVPWFWSNQYDLRLQTVGLSRGYDETVVRGDIASRSFSVIYRRKGRVIALDCVNAPRDYAQGKALVQRRIEVSRQSLMDTRLSLKDVAELATQGALPARPPQAAG